jgi:hypothetical protein
MGIKGDYPEGLMGDIHPDGFLVDGYPGTELDG